jgi:hypothetical protein
VFSNSYSFLPRSADLIKDTDACMIRDDVRKLSQAYTTIATTSEQVATDGISLSDRMIRLLEDVVSGQEWRIQERITEAISAGDALSRSAMSLQLHFTQFREALRFFGTDLHNTRERLRKSKKDSGWWAKCFGVVCGLLCAVTAVLVFSFSFTGIGAVAVTSEAVYAAGATTFSGAAAVKSSFTAALALFSSYMRNSE